MRVKVDLNADALYFRLSEELIESSEEVSSGVVLDHNKDGKVVGIEILGIKGRFRPEELSNLQVEMPTVA